MVHHNGRHTVSMNSWSSMYIAIIWWTHHISEWSIRVSAIQIIRVFNRYPRLLLEWWHYDATLLRISKTLPPSVELLWSGWRFDNQRTYIHTYKHTTLHLHLINSMKPYSCVSFRICTPVFKVAEVELKRAHASNLAANKFLMVDCASFIDQPGQRVRLSHTHCIQNSAGRREAADKDNRACNLSTLMYACQGNYTVRLFARKHKVTMNAECVSVY